MTTNVTLNTSVDDVLTRKAKCCPITYIARGRKTGKKNKPNTSRWTDQQVPGTDWYSLKKYSVRRSTNTQGYLHTWTILPGFTVYVCVRARWCPLCGRKKGERGYLITTRHLSACIHGLYRVPGTAASVHPPPHFMSHPTLISY